MRSWQDSREKKAEYAMPQHRLAKPYSQGGHLLTSPQLYRSRDRPLCLQPKAEAQTSVLLHYVVAGIGIEGPLPIPAFTHIKAKRRQL